MAKKQDKNLFQKLTDLFRSGPVVKRKIRSFDTAVMVPDKTKSSGALLFQKSQAPTYATITANAYNLSERLMRYQDFNEMEYCLHGGTRIAVPGGYKTLEELSVECTNNPDHTFIVYAYDHNLGRIIPALGKQARQTRVDESFLVKFDNGQEIIGTSNHRLMKRDGTFCTIEDLRPGDAMMPFYRRDLFGEKKDEGDGYRWIYTMDRRSGMKGWTSEHRLIGEFIKGSPLEPGEVVHHCNFIRWDNNPSNLAIMTEEDHKRLHSELLNGKKWSADNEDWIARFKENHSRFMVENNPAERKDITFGRILELAEKFSFNSKKICDALDTDPNVIKRKLKRAGYSNFEVFAKAYNPSWKNAGWDNSGENNPRFDHSVTFDSICSSFQKGQSIKELSEKIGTTPQIISGRLKSRGYSSYKSFSETYSNLKVVSVEPYGVIPLYDLTVDGYKNFATDSVISHNTPEIAAALDIYSDETVAQDEKGRVLHIFSDNEKIRDILEDLFYNTLNVEFNLRSWARNLVKFGDFFLYNDVHPDYGVVSAFPIPVNEIEREENYDPNDPMAVRYRWVTLGNRTLENWEVTHFRLLGNDMFLPYGSSVIEPARRIWRQLILIEDAMLVYRVVRAPERRVFYIDVANIPAAEVPTYVEEQRKNLRSNQVIDRNSGRVDLRYNPMSVDEDFYIPVRGTDTGTRIETLAGGQNTAAVEDVAYIQKKLFAALKIPRAYLGYDEMLSCVVPETKVDLLDGRSLSLEEIKTELEAGKSLWVYSVDPETREMKPGKILWCGPTRKDADLVRVTLDNGKTFDTTPDHKWMLRDGSWCQAGDLKPGTSLMPLYKRQKSMNGGATYEQVFDPATGKWVWTHRLVTDRSGVVEAHPSSLAEGKSVVHHRDINRFNNNPDNLIVMGYDAHRQLHVDLLDETRKVALREGKYSGLNNGWAAACREKVQHLWSMQSLITWCQSSRPTSKRQIVRGYGLPETQLDSLLRENGMSYGDFATNYVSGGYKLSRPGNKGTFSHRPHKKINGVGRGSRGAHYEVRACPQCGAHFEISSLNRKIFCGSSCRYSWVRGRAKSDMTGPPIIMIRPGLLNHTVLSVDSLSEKRDTWCMEVAGVHTFGLTDGSIISNSKATLAQEDIRFSRTINVIQRVMLSELNKLAIIHLYANGFDGEDLQNFVLRLSNPSTIAQQQKLELWRAKFEIGGAAPEGYVSKNFVRKEIWGLSDEECKKIDEGRLTDKVVDQNIETSAAGGGGDDDSGGDVGGGDMFGGSDEGGDTGGDAGGGDLFGGGEENASDDPLKDDDNDGNRILLSALDNDDDETFSVNMFGGQNPVSPSNKIGGKRFSEQKRTRKKERTPRRAKHEKHLPDFYNMTTDQPSLGSDPFGLSDPPFKSSDFRLSEDRPRTSIPHDVLSSLRNFSKKFGEHKNNILNEQFNVEDRELFILDEDDSL
jgi:intein/homing endonuclease